MDHSPSRSARSPRSTPFGPTLCVPSNKRTGSTSITMRVPRSSDDSSVTFLSNLSTLLPSPSTRTTRMHSLDSNRNLTDSFARPPRDASPSLLDELRKSLDEFSEELLRICHLNSLSRRPSHHLSEEEVFVGTISSATSKDPRMRREATTRLQEQTEHLFEAVRVEVGGADDDDNPSEGMEWAERRERAWAGWELAMGEDQTRFGVKSFAYVCMGILLKLADEDDEE